MGKERPKSLSNNVSKDNETGKNKGTAPEISLRRELYARGIGYRVQLQPKDAGIGQCSIDIAFPGKKLLFL